MKPIQNGEPCVIAEAGLKKPMPFPERTGAGNDQEMEAVPRRTGGSQPASAILLMSSDAALAENLQAADEFGEQTLVRVTETAAMFRALRAVRPAAVLLDLDMPTGAAWEAADRLLGEACVPPILLLTARAGQMDFRMAIRTGSVIDKSMGPGRLARVLNQALEAPPAVRAERTAIQRVVVLWLNPFHPAGSAPAYRDFGINE